GLAEGVDDQAVAVEHLEREPPLQFLPGLLVGPGRHKEGEERPFPQRPPQLLLELPGVSLLGRDRLTGVAARPGRLTSRGGAGGGGGGWGLRKVVWRGAKSQKPPRPLRASGSQASSTPAEVSSSSSRGRSGRGRASG